MSSFEDDPRLGLLKELADPVRLRVIDRLGQGGPATVSRLAAELEIPLPRLSNHLRRLREAGLVDSLREGRRVIYALTDPGLEQLTLLLDSVTGRVLQRTEHRPAVPDVPSRTCYDHLGGRIGVSIYAALRERDALRPRPDGVVELGPAAPVVFARLGVDPDAVPAGRQRYAFECLDATERAPHLAGALGDALAGALIAREWVTRTPGSRQIELTTRGRRGLRAALGIAPG